MSDIRWDGYSHEEIYEAVHTGPGRSASAAAESAWADVQALILRIDQRITTAMNGSASGWEGGAADAARAALSPLAQWASDAANDAGITAHAVTAQGEQAQELRNTMPEPNTAQLNAERVGVFTDPHVHLPPARRYAGRRDGGREPCGPGGRPHEHLHDQLLREPQPYGLLDAPAPGDRGDHGPVGGGGRRRGRRQRGRGGRTGGGGFDVGGAAAVEVAAAGAPSQLRLRRLPAGLRSAARLPQPLAGRWAVSPGLRCHPSSPPVPARVARPVERPWIARAELWCRPSTGAQRRPSRAVTQGMAPEPARR